MDKFVTRLKRGQPSSSSTIPPVASSIPSEVQRDTNPLNINFNYLKADPANRRPIAEYDPNIRDEVRRYYIKKGPCQPMNHDFPKTQFGKKKKTMCQFHPGRFKGRHSKWLEYSISKDAAYCLCCYLFKNEHDVRGNMGDAFTKKGYKGWNKAKERFKTHIGEVNNIHNKCFNMMIDLINQSQSIRTSFDKRNEKYKNESRHRLGASIDVARFLLRLGLPFRGHDESISSTNRGIFLELLQWYGAMDQEVGSIILQNAPKNEMTCCPKIQKDIVDACAKETIKAIIEDLDGDYFGILVDESKDISHKEQMALVLRYVDKKGEVIERFVGIVHVNDTSARSMKETVYSFLSDHSLSPSQIRGQGYDGASNMQGELNGLKSLILRDTPSAYSTHCFAHQLQLTLVALVKKTSDVDDFFCIVTNVLNIVEASYKRRDLLRQHQAAKLEELLISGKMHTGRGLNQERGLQQPGDTRWGSHYKTLQNFINIFPSILYVLEFAACECPNYIDRLTAESLVDKIKGFDFVFMLHLMLEVLKKTNYLNCSLQKMDQDIVNAMGLLNTAKQELQMMRDRGWKSLLDDVLSFCNKHEIFILKMDANYIPGKSKRRALDVTYSHHFRVGIFYPVIDLLLQELNNRFDTVSTDLLLGMACLHPAKSFGNFDKKKAMRLAEYYPNEFDSNKLRDLSCQLHNFIVHVRGSDKRFFNMKGITDLAKVLVQSELHQTWPLVYLLIKLTLILPVATASVERAFSSMKYIKNELRNSMSDEFLNGCLVCYVERGIFATISNDAIIHHFQKMKSRRVQL
ncbi:uncharacterized protein LOC132601341 [Lycium barbarum]|uniref:uncharacterized protein LOC132601341 n=1 Tax=Lycium barbarum TaxID=112863 RepID=UPI00293F693D|nr:uncharacterized protein LOC132601341 [Lycium barbarum]